MKMHDKPRIELLYAQDNLIIPFEKGQIPALSDLIRSFGELPIDKDYTVKIEEIRHKRSLDANAYFWTLVGQLAKKLNKGNIEVYQQLIFDSGTYHVLGMNEKAMDSFKKQWESNGDGWIVVDVGPSPSKPEYHFVRAYPGSSTYDTKEMARLIDATVQECKTQGIETLTPNEIQRLKNEWRTI